MVLDIEGPGCSLRKTSFRHPSDGVLMDRLHTLPFKSQGPYLPVWVDLLRVRFVGWAVSRTFLNLLGNR